MRACVAFFGAVLLVFVGAQGCSSGAGGCQSKKFCSADPDPVITDGGTSASAICEQKKCGDLYSDFQSCLQRSDSLPDGGTAPAVKCGPDNKTDIASLIAAYSKCQPQLDKYTKCVSQ